MFLIKSKILIYIILFSFVLNLILPINSFAIDEDSIYVWSNNSASVSTATTPTEEIQNSTPQDTSRKFLRNYFWWCSINGSKNWNYSI